MFAEAPICGAEQIVPDVRFHLPAPALREFVTSYYVVDAPGPLHDSLHPEWANIRFSFGGIWEFEDFHSDDILTPPVASIFGPTDRGRRFSTSGGSLIRRAGRASSREELTRRAHAALVAGEIEDVGDFAAQVGVERRTLNRLCVRVFGFTPVRLLARQRFLRTLGAVRDHLDRPLSEVIDGAYYAQAHFNRDFKAFMGMTPMAYFNSPREVLRRAGTERREALGAAVQGLHPAKPGCPYCLVLLRPQEPRSTSATPMELGSFFRRNTE